VDVDRVRLDQALVNLLANAIREAPEGSLVELSARIMEADGSVAAAETADHVLELVVEDRGPGVASEIRPLLFHPFASPARGRSGGHGLGLATAAAAVRAHGGSIEYTDRSGGGATFRLRIPTRVVGTSRIATAFEQVSEPLTAATARV
jgi:signal transduction histidine kinase